MHKLSDKTIAAFERRLSEVGRELEDMVRSWEAAERDSGSAASDVSSLTRARLAAELRRVKSALSALTAGVFGRCRRCAEPIEKDRLQADPAARFCERCSRDGADEDSIRAFTG
ncbi:MAG: TraR/DksA C4-type zinc finger protein [Woeseia sp.]